MHRTGHLIGIGLLTALISAMLAMSALLGFARIHDYQILGVQTGSMLPAISPGDAVLLRPGRSGYAVGDIVSYRGSVNPKLIITHRIISQDHRTGRVITKGDYLTSADPPVVSDLIIGKVYHVVPYAGFGLDVLRTPAGLVSAVYLPGSLLVWGEITRLMRYYERRYYRLTAYQS